MFSIKEWNFEEYKAAVKEIEDPVDRLDELKARLGNCWIEWLNYDAEFEDEVFSQGEYENICLRFEIFKKSGSNYCLLFARKKTGFNCQYDCVSQNLHILRSRESLDNLKGWKVCIIWGF